MSKERQYLLSYSPQLLNKREDTIRHLNALEVQEVLEFKLLLSRYWFRRND